MSEYDRWCQERGCTHAHCPHDCEHPQPFMHEGKLVCGRCLIVCKVVTEMVPCVPGICE